MMLKSVFLLSTILFSCTHLISADCCAKITVDFRAVDKSKDCSLFGGWIKGPNRNVGGGFGDAHAWTSSITNLIMKNCEIDVCGDGEPVGNRENCAVGECNPAGCKCTGGCVPGEPKDAMDALQRKYPGQLKELGFSRPAMYTLIEIFS